jgi:sugar O-acyltransferase (sialic acid O-acetyltransferase NeuD family)
LRSACDILIIGASGHAKVIVDILEQANSHRVIGFLDSFKDRGTSLMGYEVLGTEEEIPRMLGAGIVAGGIVAIGHNWARCQMAERIRLISPGFDFVSAIHPSARIAKGVQIGRGVAIMAGVSVNPGTRIGDFCFINTNASVDHDNVLEEFSCLQPNAATGGNVRIGAFSAVSMGANIVHGVSIGAHTVIGAGATVLSDIPDHVVAYGTPCRVVRPRAPSDNYY